MINIDIFSGFLGAGKTTLIKKLLSEAYSNEKLALIENEFGEIGIDGGFLKDSSVNVTEMNSGCICCSLVGDFGKALKEVINTYSPDRIIIEPSGVGKLSDVIKAVKNADLNDDTNFDVRLNNFVTVVDATKFKMYSKNFSEFFTDQIKSAKVVILSRTQKLNEEKIQDVINQIRELNSHASLITTPWDEVSGKDILNAMENENTFADELIKEATKSFDKHHHEEDHEHCTCHEHDEEHEHHEHCTCHEHDEEHEHHEHCTCHEHNHHHHHADEVFSSLGFETAHLYSKDEMESILNKLANTNEFGMVLRAKGIVKGQDEWIYFDLVPQEYEIRFGKPDVSGKICVIGSNLDENKIKDLFFITK